jgi:hypothetical protein
LAPTAPASSSPESARSASCLGKSLCVCVSRFCSLLSFACLVSLAGFACRSHLAWFALPYLPRLPHSLP